MQYLIVIRGRVVVVVAVVVVVVGGGFVVVLEDGGCCSMGGVGYIFNRHDLLLLFCLYASLTSVILLKTLGPFN